MTHYITNNIKYNLQKLAMNDAEGIAEAKKKYNQAYNLYAESSMDMEDIKMFLKAL